ncbi:hypothetical protein [Succinimonas amylolytica]|uniref:hypothetical protein n=1 Tax=Succinimonas amylolytica TaxID=83769 RepID=UPI0023A875B5
MKSVFFNILKKSLPAAGAVFGLVLGSAAHGADTGLFSAITADFQAEVPEGKAADLYAGFCPGDPEIQAAIDYYVIHNNRKRIYVQDIPQALKLTTQDTSYVSKNSDMPSRSFPLVNWIYNSITWSGEPMKFYYLVRGSWAAAPVYNITPDREAKPTGRLVMVFATGDSYNLLETEAPEFQSPDGCKNDNFCNDRLKDFKPFRKIMMVTREDEQRCSAALYSAARVDVESTVGNVVARNEVRFFAPHGNFVFEILHRDWRSADGKAVASITHDLSTLTINGEKYKMIPGGGPWNKGVGYLKGNGKYHEKWYYMYPAGSEDQSYSESTQLTARTAGRLVFMVFNKTTFDNELWGSERFVLYPQKPAGKKGKK